MSEQDTPQAVSPEEDARIGATPATFANKLYLTMMAGGAKITFAEAQRVAGGTRYGRAWRYSCNAPTLPPCTGCSTRRSTPPLLRRTAAGHRRAAGTGRQRPNPDNALPDDCHTYRRPGVIRRYGRPLAEGAGQSPVAPAEGS